jgi:serine/threonine protein kinase
MIDRLQELHSIGYLHLDLKPDNILLGSDVKNMASSILYLVDFGISKTYLDESLDHLPYRNDIPF